MSIISFTTETPQNRTSRVVVGEADYGRVVSVVTAPELPVFDGVLAVVDPGLVAMALDAGHLEADEGGPEGRAAEGQALVIAQLSTHDSCNTSSMQVVFDFVFGFNSNSKPY